MRHALEGLHFDCVIDFIAFQPSDVERDIELFEGRIDLVGCTGPEQRCARIAGCLSRTVWQRLSEAFRREAAAITLADILNSPPACVSEYSI